ncbi:hypothetical protein B296_00045283 [Ensete ventricosum]|uniref:Uncharacterized protein n=1 Tax=Ensete ventricosum TaxID=4639 RepID=A0A426WZA2_ENSVE|nr:hypothetical protein B296_00045283 [Ensete ventricosum]
MMEGHVGQSYYLTLIDLMLSDGVAAPCGRQSPCQGAATLAAGVTTPTGDRAGHGRLCRRLLVAAPAALATAGRPSKGVVRGRPPLQGVWPWLAALVEGLAMAGHPLYSLLLLRKCSKNR